MSARQDEFERAVMPHSRSLLRVARRLTPGASVAEDLVQETLLSGWRAFHQFQPGSNIRAWLFRILFNVFYAEGRKTRARPVMMPLNPELASRLPFLDEELEIARALDSLELDHRSVLLLGVVEGFTCRETADILGIPIGTVMSRLSRARLAMRMKLAARTPRAACAGKEA